MSKGRELTIVVTGGGTGGHLFPGIAVAQEIMDRAPGCRVVFIGTGRLVDRNAMSHYGFETKTIHCSGLKGGTFWAKIKTLAQLPVSFLESLLLLKNIRPSLVLGVGGYVTGPVVLAAKVMGIASCIHEQNSVPGMANRKLGPIVDRIFLSIPGSENFFPSEKCLHTGNPLRREILKLAAGRQSKKRGKCLLVLGGSQGAHAVNKLVANALVTIKHQLSADFKVLHQTGKIDRAWVDKEYQQAGIDAEVTEFIDQMEKAYDLADVVVSRAGATTLAELTVVKRASILIPYPFAADNHQQKNAQVLEEKGAAIICSESELTAEILGNQIISLLEDNVLLEKMERKAGEAAMPDAVLKIADECMKLIDCNEVSS